MNKNKINFFNDKRVIVFDLGGVIFKFDHMLSCKRLSKISGIPVQNIYENIFKSEIGNHYDEGKITSNEFYIAVNNFLKTNLSINEFNNIWSDIFKENLGVSILIRELKNKNYKLYLLSNTNEMHFNFIKNKFEIINIFDDYILSYKIGYRKPNIKIFNILLEKTGFEASQHIYIDDLENFVNIARSIGMIGIVFTSSVKLKQELRNNNIFL